MLGEFYCSVLVLYLFALSAYGEKSTNSVKNISIPTNYTNLQHNVKTTTNALLPDYISSTTEDLTHYGREHLKYFKGTNEPNASSQLDNLSKMKTPASVPLLSIDLKPQYDSSGEKNDGKSIVPKKGVFYNMSDITSTSSYQITSTNKAVITNIKFGENDTNELNIVISKNQSENISLKPIQVHEDEMKIGSRSNIVLPVIAVILSIPLVGLLIVVFYKRGAEWWQHRHYRRMDFLIDGMYNN